jgi:hypothetical protein
MQWLTLVPEDSGVQRLKADSRRPKIVRGVDRLAPYGRTAPVQSGKPLLDTIEPVHDRRRGERRRNPERRHEQLPVMLDTRCTPERRNTPDRRAGSGSAENEPVASSRIDLYA